MIKFKFVLCLVAFISRGSLDTGMTNKQINRKLIEPVLTYDVHPPNAQHNTHTTGCLVVPSTVLYLSRSTGSSSDADV